MNTVIEVQGLSKAYKKRGKTRQGDASLAVNNISFAVTKGEIFGILGPNGAGKTTTLEILEGLKKQTGGTVLILGLDMSTAAEEVRKRIGVQLQSSEYLPSLTLAELLRLFASFYGRSVDPLAVLALVGLTDKASEEVRNLSGGQKQRFTIASSMVNEPEILFLDEPTTGLDPKARRDLWGLIRSINEAGVTIVMTTHYMEEAEFLCNRVAIMDHGTILKIDEPSRLIQDLSHTTQISFLTPGTIEAFVWIPLRGEIEKIYSNYPKVTLEVKSLSSIGKVIARLQEQGVKFSGFAVRTASLEDVYLDLTGKEYEV